MKIYLSVPGRIELNVKSTTPMITDKRSHTNTEPKRFNHYTRKAKQNVDYHRLRKSILSNLNNQRFPLPREIERKMTNILQ
jgi:hypothetical protein